MHCTLSQWAKDVRYERREPPRAGTIEVDRDKRAGGASQPGYWIGKHLYLRRRPYPLAPSKLPAPEPPRSEIGKQSGGEVFEHPAEVVEHRPLGLRKTIVVLGDIETQSCGEGETPLVEHA